MIESYEIKTDELSVKILNYGATIADICFRGRHMVLRFADLENYRNPKLNQAFGSTVGRFANRFVQIQTSSWCDLPVRIFLASNN